MPGLHLVATLVEVALGGRPAHWFYPPIEPERMAAVAIALLVGIHLDNDQRAPESEVRLRVLRLAVLVLAAGLAARALSAKRAAPAAA